MLFCERSHAGTLVIQENFDPSPEGDFLAGMRQLVVDHREQCLPGEFEEIRLWNSQVTAFLSSDSSSRYTVIWREGDLLLTVTGQTLSREQALSTADRV